MSASKIFLLRLSQHECFANEIFVQSSTDLVKKPPTTFEALPWFNTIPSHWRSSTKIALRSLSIINLWYWMDGTAKIKFSSPLFTTDCSYPPETNSTYFSAGNLDFQRRIHNQENQSPMLWLATSTRLRYIPRNVRSHFVPFFSRPTPSVPANWTRRLWTLRFKNTFPKLRHTLLFVAQPLEQYT